VLDLPAAESFIHGTHRLSVARNRLYTVQNHLYMAQNHLYMVKNHLYTVKNRLYTVKNHLYTVKNRLYMVKNYLSLVRNRFPKSGRLASLNRSNFTRPGSGDPGPERGLTRAKRGRNPLGAILDLLRLGKLSQACR